MQKITHLFYISTEKTDDNGLLYDFDIDVLVLVASQVWYSWLVEKDRNYVSQDWKKFASLGILKLEQQNLKKKNQKKRFALTTVYIFSLSPHPPYHHIQFMVNTLRINSQITSSKILQNNSVSGESQ